MKIKQHIPNIITLLNATSGTLATYYMLRYERIVFAICLMLLGALFDFFDGFAARKLRAFSPLGKDLDSLADVVSFGVAPAAMMAVALSAICFPLPEIAFLIVPASVYRLAKFNNDTRQSTSFIGLPTPANALFFAGLAYWTIRHSEAIIHLPIMIEYKIYPMYVVVILLMSWLMISEIPMFSLKGTGGNTPKARRSHYTKVIVLLSIGAVAIFLWSFTGFAVMILAYLLINLYTHLRGRIP